MDGVFLHLEYESYSEIWKRYWFGLLLSNNTNRFPHTTWSPVEKKILSTMNIYPHKFHITFVRKIYLCIWTKQRHWLTYFKWIISLKSVTNIVRHLSFRFDTGYKTWIALKSQWLERLAKIGYINILWKKWISFLYSVFSPFIHSTRHAKHQTHQEKTTSKMSTSKCPLGFDRYQNYQFISVFGSGCRDGLAMISSTSGSHIMRLKMFIFKRKQGNGWVFTLQRLDGTDSRVQNIICNENLWVN